MPVPHEITNMLDTVQLCGTFPRTFGNPKPAPGTTRTQITKTFRVYLELVMQAKHDVLISGHCKSLKLTPRRTDGSQITHRGAPTATALLGAGGFYEARAGQATDTVLAQMITKWQGGTTFTVATRVDASVQGVVQTDGYRYELSYWYDNADVYILFHCYP